MREMWPNQTRQRITAGGWFGSFRRKNLENHTSFPGPRRQKLLEDERTLLFEKKQSPIPDALALVIVGIMLFLFFLYWKDDIPFYVSVIIFIFGMAVTTDMVLSVRRTPEKIYGARDGLLVIRRGSKEKIPYTNIDRIEVKHAARSANVSITLLFLKPGKSGDRLKILTSLEQTNAFLERLAACGGPCDVPLNTKYRRLQEARRNVRDVVFRGVPRILIVCLLVIILAQFLK
jgi:hypothetical protein